MPALCLECGEKLKRKEKTCFGIWNDTCSNCGKTDIPCADAGHDFGVYDTKEAEVRDKISETVFLYNPQPKPSKKPKIKTRTILSIAQFKKAVQRDVNAYIRRRDAEEPCISCQKRCEAGEAGHYIAQGSSGFLRYNPLNIHKQCVSCNKFKHGNLVEYRIFLVNKIGLDKVEWLESVRHTTKKWTREELEEVRRNIKTL